MTSELNAIQCEAAQYLAEGLSKAQVAKRVGVSRGTIYNWMNVDGFGRAIQKARAEIISRTNDRFIQGREEALEVLL